jgi:hypothetical protein
MITELQFALFFSMFIFGWGVGNFLRKGLKKKVFSQESLICEVTAPFKIISSQISDDIKNFVASNSDKMFDNFDVKSVLISDHQVTKQYLSRKGWLLNGVPYAEAKQSGVDCLNLNGLKLRNISSNICQYIRADMHNDLGNMGDFLFTFKISITPTQSKIETKNVLPNEVALLAAELETNETLKNELEKFGVHILLNSKETQIQS